MGAPTGHARRGALDRRGVALHSRSSGGSRRPRCVGSLGARAVSGGSPCTYAASPSPRWPACSSAPAPTTRPTPRPRPRRRPRRAPHRPRRPSLRRHPNRRNEFAQRWVDAATTTMHAIGRDSTSSKRCPDSAKPAWDSPSAFDGIYESGGSIEGGDMTCVVARQASRRRPKVRRPDLRRVSADAHQLHGVSATARVKTSPRRPSGVSARLSTITATSGRVIGAVSGVA